MSHLTLSLFCAALVVISVLYSCVGQAGASGYIAAMALFGFAPDTIKPTALVLNVLVSVVVSVRVYRSGHFSWTLLWPFAAASVPTALIGGYLTLPPLVFDRLLGSLLLVAAVPFFLGRGAEAQAVSPPRRSIALAAGAGVGLLAGLTGVGGGVLITPLLLHCRWATAKSAAAVSAVFILINSVAALVGHLGATRALPPDLPLFSAAAVLGGAIGSYLGSVHLSAAAIYRILGSVLLIAGVKLLVAHAG